MEKFGLSRTTFAKVALLARTSRSVLYRRWKTPNELVVDAFRDLVRHDQNGGLAAQVFDSGNLRDDLIKLMKYFASANDRLSPEFARLLLDEFANADNPHAAELREAARHSDLVAMDKILASARARGEISREPSETAKLLPFEILRYQMLTERIDLSDNFIANLVDEILMPTFTRA